MENNESSKKPTIYIAGPMTGLPGNNYQAFNDAAQKLRVMGYTVENPAENPSPVCGQWLGWMRLAIPQMINCDVVLLLDGWEKSKGAKIEADLANSLGLKITRLDWFLAWGFNPPEVI